MKNFETFINESNEKEMETIKKQVLDFVEKKGKATWKEIHSFILNIKDLNPNDRSNRGRYASYFSGLGIGCQYNYNYDRTKLPKNKYTTGLLMRPTKKDPRYLEKEGNFYIVKYEKFINEKQYETFKSTTFLSKNQILEIKKILSRIIPNNGFGIFVRDLIFENDKNLNWAEVANKIIFHFPQYTNEIKKIINRD